MRKGTIVQPRSDTLAGRHVSGKFHILAHHIHGEGNLAGQGVNALVHGIREIHHAGEFAIVGGGSGGQQPGAAVTNGGDGGAAVASGGRNNHTRIEGLEEGQFHGIAVGVGTTRDGEA